MAYITKTEVATYLGISINNTLQTYIDTLISGVEDYIERVCGGGIFTKRRFQDDDVEKTFYYDGNSATKLAIDDLREITSLTVDFISGSGTALTENDDYFLYPLNANNDDLPFTEVQLIQPSTRLNLNSRLQSSAPYIFDEGQKTVKIVGKFGYSTTPPDAIKLACMKLVGAIIKENIGDTDLRELSSETLGDYSANFTKIKDIAERLGVNNLLIQYTRKSIKPKIGMREAS